MFIMIESENLKTKLTTLALKTLNSNLLLIRCLMKTVNLRYITVGRLDDDMIVPPSDGAMFILID